MRKILLALIVIFSLSTLAFANQKSSITGETNNISFSLISNYSNSFNGNSVTNYAASDGIDSDLMTKLGIRLTISGISNIVDGAIWVAVSYAFLWLMWTEIYPVSSTFDTVAAWGIAFGPLSSNLLSTAGLWAFLADFFLIFGIISLILGTCLLIPGIILWVVGATSGGSSAKAKKEQKIMPLYTGDKLGLSIKL